MKKIGATLITSVVFLVLLTMTVFGAGTSKGNATAIQLDTPYQSNLALLETEWYKITPNETQYYRFHVLNQSVESRTGIANGYLDDFINFFQGYLTVTVRDQYDMTLAEYDIRCGYEGRISLKLQQGQTYYVFVNSTVTGNYRLSATKLADIGADTWSAATSTISNAQIISAIDATTDSDWFTFKAELERAYYTFKLENISGTSNMNFILYQYVEGAGEFPMREIKSMSVGRNSTKSFNLQLEENSKYYYRIYGNGSCTGGYQLDVTMRLDAAGNSMGEAYSVDIGEKYVSSFDGTEDKDYYCFETSTDDAYYHFSLENLNESETYMYVFDAAENELIYEFVRYDAETRNIKLKPNKTYYVLLKGSNSNYEFKITEKKDIYPNLFEEAATISVNKEILSSFDGSNDADYFKFKTGGNSSYYHFSLENLNESETYMYVFDAAENELIYELVRYDAETRNIKLETNKTYYVLLKGSNSNYEFKITEKKDIYPNLFEEAATISVNKEILSSFDGSNDADYFKFKTGGNSSYYHFSLENLNESETYMYVFDAAENELIYELVRYDAETRNIKLETNKTYYVLLKGSNSNYKFKITYTIDADSDEKENATSIKLNTPKESHLEASSDVDWFKIRINSPGEYRVRCYSLSSTSVSYRVYNSYDGFVDMGYYATYLQPGTYYVKITGNQGYYYFILADCGSAHKESTTYEPKSTTKQSGVKKTVCKSCKQTLKTETVPQIKSVKLSAKEFVYNGKVRRPKIIVTDTTGTEIKSYSVSWSNKNSTAPGKYTATVTFNGAYSGTKTLTYTIAPKATSKITASQSTTAINLKWNKVTGADGYRIYMYNTKTKKWDAVKTVSASTLSYKVKDLKEGTKYKFKIKAYKKVNGETIWGKATDVFETATKCKTPSIKKLTTTKGEATFTWSNVSGESGYQVYYSTKKDSGFKKVASYKVNVVKGSKKKLKSGKKYYFKVRAYKKTDSGTVYSAWSAVKSVKIK